MEDTKIIDITINYNGRTIERTYAVKDGQVPEGMGEFIQEMTDTLLDETKPAF